MQGFELVFYGDSISEDWRGTSAGIPWPLASGTADVFYKHFGSKYNAEVLAIAGGRPKLLSACCNCHAVQVRTLRRLTACSTAIALWGCIYHVPWKSTMEGCPMLLLSG